MSLRILPVAVLMLSPLAVSAQGFEGFYIGAQIGTADVDTNVGVDGDETIFGIHAGYLAQSGAFVFGGELDYDNFDLDLSGGAGELEDVTRIKARGGYDFGGTLVYGTAGFAFANTSDLGDDDGYFLGIGAEFDIPAPGRIGAEYLYHEFDDFDGSDIDVEADTFAIRYSYNF